MHACTGLCIALHGVAVPQVRLEQPGAEGTAHPAPPLPFLVPVSR